VKIREVWIAGISILLAQVRVAGAQPVPLPAQAAQEGQENRTEGPRQDEQSGAVHVPSYVAVPKYETVVKTGLRENQPIGDYEQPRWTASRLFPTTRIYVVPPGTVQLEYWLDTKLAFPSPSDVRYRNLYELELGLGHRLQLDFYLRTEQDGQTGPLTLESEKIELRWALADWGRIWGNPTLYFEVSRFSDAPPTLESKLLLGGSIASRVHWGLNLVYERDLSGAAKVNQYGVTSGIDYAIIDYKLSAGLELLLESADNGTDRNHLQELSVVAGPSIQWRPTPPVHIDLVVMFGAMGERQDSALSFDPGMRQLLVVGYEL
jgi:hypothetical protein